MVRCYALVFVLTVLLMLVTLSVEITRVGFALSSLIAGAGGVLARPRMRADLPGPYGGANPRVFIVGIGVMAIAGMLALGMGDLPASLTM